MLPSVGEAVSESAVEVGAVLLSVDEAASESAVEVG